MSIGRPLSNLSLPIAKQPAGPEPARNQWFCDEVKPHEFKLRAWLRKRFSLLTDVDDVIQETYFRLFRAKDAGKIVQTKPYLYTVARNVVLDHFRHEKVIPVERITEMRALPVLDEKPDARSTTSRDEELALLATAIQALPERCREVLVLRKLHGLSQKEIARKLGISENTVAAHASMGVRRCIEYFREHETKGRSP